jgi:hypothetical protein
LGDHDVLRVDPSEILVTVLAEQFLERLPVGRVTTSMAIGCRCMVKNVSKSWPVE